MDKREFYHKVAQANLPYAEKFWKVRYEPDNEGLECNVGGLIAAAETHSVKFYNQKKHDFDYSAFCTFAKQVVEMEISTLRQVEMILHLVSCNINYHTGSCERKIPYEKWKTTKTFYPTRAIFRKILDLDKNRLEGIGEQLVTVKQMNNFLLYIVPFWRTTEKLEFYYAEIKEGHCIYSAPSPSEELEVSMSGPMFFFIDKWVGPNGEEEIFFKKFFL
ncbi:MAG: hypothetical protein LBL47_04975 [Lactobacillus sp.]|jgi:hypothetical protein|nr:hypothetical protein [Lactobacillus sp.]